VERLVATMNQCGVPLLHGDVSCRHPSSIVPRPDRVKQGHLFAAGRAENDVEMPALPKLGPMQMPLLLPSWLAVSQFLLFLLRPEVCRW
jgi:hypothetical protein